MIILGFYYQKNSAKLIWRNLELFWHIALSATSGHFRILLPFRFLRKINLCNFRVSKNVISCSFFKVLNLFILVNFSPQQMHKFFKIKFRACKNVKVAVFEHLESSKLISRKIWLSGNYWNVNFEDSRCSKTAFLTFLEALNFDFEGYLHFLRAENDQNKD